MLGKVKSYMVGSVKSYHGRQCEILFVRYVEHLYCFVCPMWNMDFLIWACSVEGCSNVVSYGKGTKVMSVWTLVVHSFVCTRG